MQLELFSKNLIQDLSNLSLNVATVFSGIGSPEQALINLGIKHNILFACDNDNFVKQSYLANYQPEKWYSDVKEIDGTKYKDKIDLLVGGSPCQSFSTAGKRKGFEDTRGTLFYEFARIIKESQPKVFIYENVTGLINHDKGKTFEIILNTFKELGYTYYYQVLNAKDYGTSQSRSRIFIIGFKNKNINYIFPEKELLTNTTINYLETNVDKKYYLSQRSKNYVFKESRLGFCSFNNYVQQCQLKNQQVNLNGMLIIEVLKEQNHDKCFDISELIFTQHIYSRVDYLIDGHTKEVLNKQDLNIDYKYFQIRKLTPKECLRLMGFNTDTFKIVCSDLQMYYQSGNSIVVSVLEKLIKNIPFENI